eukprot:652723_1
MERLFVVNLLLIVSKSQPYPSDCDYLDCECTETSKCNLILMEHGFTQCETVPSNPGEVPPVCIQTMKLPLEMSWDDTCGGDCVKPADPLPTCTDECTPDPVPGTDSCTGINEICTYDNRLPHPITGPCLSCADACLYDPYNCVVDSDCDMLREASKYRYPGGVIPDIECTFDLFGNPDCGECTEVMLDTTSSTTTPVIYPTLSPPEKCTESVGCNPERVWYGLESNCEAGFECVETMYFLGGGYGDPCRCYVHWDMTSIDPTGMLRAHMGYITHQSLRTQYIEPTKTCADQCEFDTDCVTANNEICGYDYSQGMPMYGGQCMECVDSCLMNMDACLDVTDCDSWQEHTQYNSPYPIQVDCIKSTPSNRCGYCGQVQCAAGTCNNEFECVFGTFCDISSTSSDVCPYNCVACTGECDPLDPYACVGDQVCAKYKESNMAGNSGCYTCQSVCMTNLYGCDTDVDCEYEIATFGVSAMACHRYYGDDACGECVEVCAIGTCDPYIDSTDQCEIGFICEEVLPIDPLIYSQCSGQCVSLSASTTASATTNADTTDSGTTDSATTDADTTESGTTDSGTTASATTNADTTNTAATDADTTGSASTDAGST